MTSNVHFFNGCGLKCPHALLKLQRFARTVLPGSIINISLDNIAAYRDTEAWCKVYQHEILNKLQNQSTFIITVKIHN